jgi:hypothetical protein
VRDLAVWTDQCEFAEWRLVLHVARLCTVHETGSRAACPQRPIVHCARIQHFLYVRVAPQPFQRPDGREDDEETAGFVAGQRVSRAHPDRFELLGLVGHRRLAGGHARDEEGHVEAARQVAVGDPVRQHENVGGVEREAMSLALRGKRCLAVEGGDVAVVHRHAVDPVREQHAQLFVALADRGDGLGEVEVALCRAAGADAVGLCVGGVNAAAGEHIGAGREACRHGAARHQHFDTGARRIGAVAQQQHGGGGAQRGWCALGMQELGGSDHGGILREASPLLTPPASEPR